jgi:hypothetical protein
MISITEAGEFSTRELDELQSQLDLWRGEQGKRARLPESVWRAAAELARRLGVSPVSRSLRLNYHKLNRRTAQAKDGPQDAPTRATFVELAVGGLKGPDGNHEYRAELGDATIDRLTFHLGGDVRAVVALAESFWRRKR